MLLKVNVNGFSRRLRYYLEKEAITRVWRDNSLNHCTVDTAKCSSKLLNYLAYETHHTEILTELAKSSYDSVRLLVANNSNTATADLELLAKDKNACIASCASKKLMI